MTAPSGIRRIFADQVMDGTVRLINGVDDTRVDAGVAVIDTGIDLDHPDLNVAGTIGALDNGPDVDVVGVAPGVRLYAVKVLNNGGTGSVSNIVAGIDWVTERAGDIQVANMSLGGGHSNAECIAIENSVAAGVTYAVAAGNSATLVDGHSPADCLDVITVSAIADFNGAPGGGAAATCRSDVDDTFADFSNYGSLVEVAAPGVCILSSWKNGGYAMISGTSMASRRGRYGAARLQPFDHASVHPHRDRGRR